MRTSPEIPRSVGTGRPTAPNNPHRQEDAAAAANHRKDHLSVSSCPRMRRRVADRRQCHLLMARGGFAMSSPNTFAVAISRRTPTAEKR